MQLLKAKCSSVLFYRLKACTINKEKTKTLDYMRCTLALEFLHKIAVCCGELYDLF